jgi:hypothetical protein
MKRLLLIGFAACTFALASIQSASAMPSANLSHLLPALIAQSSKCTVGATTVVEVIITVGAEATITVGDIITIGEIKF